MTSNATIVRYVVYMVTIVATIVVTVGIASRLFYPPTVIAEESYEKNEGTLGKACIEHGDLDSMLKKHVTGDRVNYSTFKLDQQALEQYLERIAKINTDSCNRNELLALYINAYNAATILLILENYPNIKSIKDIPGKKRWDDQRWKVAGEIHSLSTLEHQVLRKRFQEPRIHFAINCASISCPPLRNEAYTPLKLEEQLNSAATYFNRDFKGVQWDVKESTLVLSRIYDWYKSDFEKDKDLIQYILPFVSPEDSESLRRKSRDRIGISFSAYDWSLNDIERNR